MARDVLMERRVAQAGTLHWNLYADRGDDDLMMHEWHLMDLLAPNHAYAWRDLE